MILGVLLLPACMATQDSWYDPAPARSGEWKELPRDSVTPVMAAQMAAAVKRLVAKPAVAISAADAMAITGKQMTGSNLFLVRGVSLNEETGGFVVYLLPGDAIEVYHGSLGRHAVPMRRHPVVVALERAPRRVYGDCGMAE